jgi:glycosyltransferase involved in cell wall biosynthesis
MWPWGVDALVVPNGLAPSAFTAPDRTAVKELRQRTRGRVVLAKAARWDPDKRWLLAVETAAALKSAGRRPLLIARGGIEAHGAQVLDRAVQLGLRVVDRRPPRGHVGDLADATADLGEVDVLNLQTPLSPEACRTLFRAASAVLVNSGHEPFGLVGLESMAAGGLTCVGGTGEDYAAAGWNALVLQTNDPAEFVRHHRRLESNPAEERALRRRAATAARQFAWPEVVRRNLLPYIGVEPASLPPPVRAMRAQRRACEGTGPVAGDLPLAARQGE